MSLMRNNGIWRYQAGSHHMRAGIAYAALCMPLTHAAARRASLHVYRARYARFIYIASI